jgi:hypothetical protein
MGKSERRKGVVGEQDVVKCFREYGFPDARRTGVAGQEDGDIASAGPYMVEVKRVERLDIPSWWAKLLGRALAKDRIPLLVFRRSSEPWKVCVDLDYFLMLTGGQMFAPGVEWKTSDIDEWVDEPSGPSPEND